MAQYDLAFSKSYRKELNYKYIQEVDQTCVSIGLYSNIHNDGLYKIDQYTFFIDGYIVDIETKLIQLVSALNNKNLTAVLEQLNGVFCLFIYDENESKLYVVNDRYGTKHVYHAVGNKKSLAISTDLKSIVFNPKINLDVNDEMLKCFIEVGHLLENNTLFKNIARVKPASIIEIDCATKEFNESQYWSWASVKQTKVTFEKAIDELHTHFVKAVSRTLDTINGKTLAITLSGGLDSRALLAEAVRQSKVSITTHTFGAKNCDDYLIAKQVSEVAGVKNYFYKINENNAFTNRAKGVLESDGMFNYTHMHALVAGEEIQKHSSYVLNGYLGDAVLGGSYLDSDNLNSNDFFCTLSKKFGSYAKHIDVNDAWYRINCTDPITVISNRGNRFVAAGTDLLEDKFISLKPFMDNDLLDYVYSLPDEYRVNSRLYNAMLLKHYPEYFKDIPNESSGTPIEVVAENCRGKGADSNMVINNNSATDTLRNSKMIRYILDIINPTRVKLLKLISNKKSYVDYSYWMRKKQSIAHFEQIFKNGVVLNNKTIFTKEELYTELNNFVKDYRVTPERLGALICITIFINEIDKLRAASSNE